MTGKKSKYCSRNEDEGAEEQISTLGFGEILSKRKESSRGELDV